jgi:hypothetical protein
VNLVNDVFSYLVSSCLPLLLCILQSMSSAIKELCVLALWDKIILTAIKELCVSALWDRIILTM